MKIVIKIFEKYKNIAFGADGRASGEFVARWTNTVS
jgi:hypothetical protein